MSLTTEDLSHIRTLVREVMHEAVRPLEVKIDAIGNKLVAVEEKLLKLNAELLLAAKQVDVELPR